MKHFFPITIGIALIVAIIALGFTLRQISLQHNSLTTDLEHRTMLLTDSLKESIRPSYISNATSTMQSVLDKFAGREFLLGLAVYDADGKLAASSADLPPALADNAAIPEISISSDTTDNDFLSVNGGKVFFFVSPLHQDEKVIGALAVFQKADYINKSINQIWISNILRLSLQLLIFFLAAFLIAKFVIRLPILRLAETIRQARSGGINADFEIKESNFFQPISAEITSMAKSLIKARTSASEEARMRLEQLDSPWTEERLKEFFKAYLKDRQIFVISNREPYSHSVSNNKIAWQVPASGMITALEPILEACGGTWIAHGSGNADKQTVDNHDKIKVPPDEPKYTLKRVWLTDKEVNGYYNGFSNEALWPLCLLAHNRPLFRKQDWLTYQEVNGKFLQALLVEIKDVQNPLILVQDYHLALLPQMIKASRPDAEVGLFWHIAWPSAEVFSICPWRKEIISGMLGADMVGFHTQQHCNNFLDTVNKEIEAITDFEDFSVTRENHTTYIKPFPISVAFTNSSKNDAIPKSAILENLGLTTEFLGVGVDRLDYAKGILEKFKGIEFFLDLHPDYIGKMTFLQIASPTREGVLKYRQFAEDVTNEADRINNRFGKDGWRPIILLKEYYSHKDIFPIYRAANFCLITSLSDGMNLVAKEFAAARNDGSGVLILSQFAGAARSMKGALVINPYSAEETAAAIHEALTMPAAEQQHRMQKMRDMVKNYNIYRWAAEFLKSLSNLS
ncbi:MAG: trehalose-6-phosphate synthase [Candidatus Buchananbacteria bacterium]|jgi:trehalose 6-phosphate synthase